MSGGPGIGGHAVRTAALRVLMRVERGRRSDRSVDEVLSASRLPPRDRGLVTEIVYGTLRRQRSLDRTLGAHCDRPLEDLDAPVRVTLRMAMYQSAFLRSVPPHAAVHRSVEALKRVRPRAVGFANAVLRAWLRAGGEIDGGDGSVADRYELPDWLASRWDARFGGDAHAWLEASLLPAAVEIRVQPWRGGAETVAARLREGGAEVTPSSRVPGCLRVDGGAREVLRELFDAGTAVPRSEGAQLVTGLLAPHGEWVLDACSGRGGKARQLAEGGLRVVCMDIDHERLRQSVALAARGEAPGLAWVRADLCRAAPLRAAVPDALVDVPCSGLGTIGRHPEIKWRVQPQQLEAFGARQQRILCEVAAHLAPSGTLLYITCSTEPEENEQVVEAALSETEGLRRDPFEAPPPGCRIDASGDLRTFPQDPGLDGFYVARLTR